MSRAVITFPNGAVRRAANLTKPSPPGKVAREARRMRGLTGQSGREMRLLGSSFRGARYARNDRSVVQHELWCDCPRQSIISIRCAEHHPLPPPLRGGPPSLQGKFFWGAVHLFCNNQFVTKMTKQREIRMNFVAYFQKMEGECQTETGFPPGRNLLVIIFVIFCNFPLDESEIPVYNTATNESTRSQPPSAGDFHQPLVRTGYSIPNL